MGFPEGWKTVHWIYKVISRSSIEQRIDVVRGRPAELVKFSVLRDHLNLTSVHEIIAAELTIGADEREREREREYKGRCRE